MVGTLFTHKTLKNCIFLIDNQIRRDITEIKSIDNSKHNCINNLHKFPKKISKEIKADSKPCQNTKNTKIQNIHSINHTIKHIKLPPLAFSIPMMQKPQKNY